MPKLAKELGALAVSKLNQPGLHFVGSVPGLALQVKASSARSWILRLVIGNKRRDMGLGCYPSVSLAHARQKASEAREMVRQGVDPIERQRAALSSLRASLAIQVTFKETALAYMAAHESGCRNHCRMVFLDKLVLRVISRIESFSRKCIRLILASMPTVITPNSPAQSLSRSFNHMGQFWVKTIALSGSVLGDRQQPRGSDVWAIGKKFCPNSSK